MEVILRAAEGDASPADLGGGCFMPPLKAFMDDTTILCSKENETRRMLVRLDALMKWSRMSLKPTKSGSLFIKKCKVDEDVFSRHLKVIQDTGMRPDIVFLSSVTRQIIMVELTVLYESRIEEASTCKREKYKGLSKELEEAGYKSKILPIVVGARRFLEHQPTTSKQTLNQ
ncbi:reverse transcriptase [Plakobranchus ocellatus]|uniref:Reverse transcriptase n=1 Tax=Plakobranchus ocellatus TaxID=259542 RepID=A0AAV4APF8_9GAST|nr:reverse transcriptase [Plakobranchus ocellatus]